TRQLLVARWSSGGRLTASAFRRVDRAHGKPIERDRTGAGGGEPCEKHDVERLDEAQQDIQVLARRHVSRIASPVTMPTGRGESGLSMTTASAARASDRRWRACWRSSSRKSRT